MGAPLAAIVALALALGLLVGAGALEGVALARATPARALLRAEEERHEGASLAALAEQSDGTERRAALRLDDVEASKETITTTKEGGGAHLQFEPTVMPASSAGDWIMVTPDSGLPTLGVSDESTTMKCKSSDASIVMKRPGSNTQGVCQRDAILPPPDLRMDGGISVGPKDVRFYQFCESCDYGNRCELVIWCLEVEVNMVKENWRLYRNVDVVPDMWYLSAGHSMCELPQSLVAKLDVRDVSSEAKSSAVASHQLACQEYATKEGFGYYQFCGSCREGQRCTTSPKCERCISMDVTDWHVFKHENAPPPCASSAASADTLA